MRQLMFKVSSGTVIPLGRSSTGRDLTFVHDSYLKQRKRPQLGSTFYSLRLWSRCVLHLSCELSCCKDKIIKSESSRGGFFLCLFQKVGHNCFTSITQWHEWTLQSVPRWADNATYAIITSLQHRYTHTHTDTLVKWLWLLYQKDSVKNSHVLKKVSNCIELGEEEFSFLR